MSLSLDVKGLAIQNSSALTAFAFWTGFEDAFGMGLLGNLIVTFSVFLFGISTMISWSYYGDRCVEYLFGVQYVIYYRLVYVCFTFMGAILALETVWAYGDLALGLMSVPNLIAVILLSPVLVRLTREYFSREHKRYK
jgi:AGCS family alanine or glycine:cation symporter